MFLSAASAAPIRSRIDASAGWPSSPLLAISSCARAQPQQTMQNCTADPAAPSAQSIKHRLLFYALHSLYLHNAGTKGQLPLPDNKGMLRSLSNAARFLHSNDVRRWMDGLWLWP